MTPSSLTVRAHDGEYEIVVEQAPRLSLWMNGPWRWWNTITRNRSWWVTVRGPHMALPVIREQLGSHELALARVDELRCEFAAGVIDGSRVAWRRVRR